MATLTSHGDISPALVEEAAELLTVEFLETGHNSCHATSKSTGDPCRKTAIPGGAVCIYHGGRVPQVQAKAALRLEALEYLATERLLERLINDEDHDMDPKVVLAIAISATDKRQLLEGGATARTETSMLERREELVIELQGRFDDLAEGEKRRERLDQELRL